MLLVISPFNSLSQLSCKVPISSASRSFCSCVNVFTHFSLSQLGLDTAASIALASVPLIVVAGTAVFGAPKKEVIEAFLTFLAPLVGSSVALRFNDMTSVRRMI